MVEGLMVVKSVEVGRSSKICVQAKLSLKIGQSNTVLGTESGPTLMGLAFNVQTCRASLRFVAPVYHASSVRSVS